MSKSKSNGRGRPQKQQNEDLEDISIDNNYIATNELALKLMEIISSFATYKLLTVTGPNSERNDEKAKITRKKVEKLQQKLRETFKISEDYTFFLRDLDNCTLQYEIINDVLVDQNKYKLNYADFENLKINNYILQSIELVNNQLNSELQVFLIEFIKQYSQYYDKEEEFKQNFLKFILNNQNKFTEVLNWGQLYDKAYDEKIELLKLEVTCFKKKYMPNEQGQSKKYKVDEKRENQLKQDLSQIEKIENNKGDHKSLKLFISDITDTLKQFWVQND